MTTNDIHAATHLIHPHTPPPHTHTWRSASGHVCFIITVNTWYTKIAIDRDVIYLTTILSQSHPMFPMSPSHVPIPCSQCPHPMFPMSPSHVLNVPIPCSQCLHPMFPMSPSHVPNLPSRVPMSPSHVPSVPIPRFTAPTYRKALEIDHLTSKLVCHTL